MQALGVNDPVHVGSYRLLGRLGAGGMGTVYLGRSPGGRTVALKLVQEELAGVPEFRARFAREVAAARRVGGEWTAAVLDSDTGAEVPWVATQYVPGPSLHEVVSRGHGPLPEFSVRALALRLALALQAVHRAGLVHRDLKPANVLVTVDGPRVIDFGIARALDGLGDADGLVTRTGVVMGSPAFMSPEQVRGEELSFASDVFSLGSVLAFAATGASPFGAPGGGLHAHMYRVAEEEPDLGGMPGGLAGLVRACLAKRPELRPTPEQVAALAGGPVGEEWLPAEVLAGLGRHSAELLDFEPPAAGGGSTRPHEVAAEARGTLRAEGTPVRRRRRVLRAGAAVLALGGVVVAGLLLRPWEADRGASDGPARGAGKPASDSAGSISPVLGDWQGVLRGAPAFTSGAFAVVRVHEQGGGLAVTFRLLTPDGVCVSRSAVRGGNEPSAGGSSGVRLTLEPARLVEDLRSGGTNGCWTAPAGRVETQGGKRLLWTGDEEHSIVLDPRVEEVPEELLGGWEVEPKVEDYQGFETLRGAHVFRDSAAARRNSGVPEPPADLAPVVLRYGEERAECEYRARVFMVHRSDPRIHLVLEPPRLDPALSEAHCERRRRPMYFGPRDGEGLIESVTVNAGDKRYEYRRLVPRTG